LFFPIGTLKIAFWLAIACSTFGHSQDSKENAEFKLAAGLYNDGMYDLAVDQFKNFINAYPNTSQGIEARFYLGLTLEKLKRFEEERITFQNFAIAYIEHPKAPEAWIRVGDAFLALNNEREAASAYERVKTFHPKSTLVPEALLKAGHLYRKIGDRENAKKNFRTVIQDYPSSASVLPARLAIGEMYAEEGQTELAEREAKRVSESDAPPAVRASALFSIGKLQSMTGLFENAEATFKTVIASYKSTPAATASTFELGKLELGSRQYASAVERFKKVSSAQSADDSLQAEALFETGRAYMLMGEASNGQKSFEKLIEKFPKSSLIQKAELQAGRSALAGEGAREALQHAKKILAVPAAPTRPAALVLAAEASSALKQNTEAARYYLSYIDAFPEDPLATDVMLKLARLYSEKLQDFRKSMGIYDQMTQKFPQSRNIVEALAGIAECQEKLGDDAGALKTYNDIQSLYPANDSYDEFQRRAEFLLNHKIKNRDAGIEKLARMMGEVLTQKSKAELSFKLGEIYTNDLKDYEAAVKQFDSAIENGLSGEDLENAYFLRARSLHLRSGIDTTARSRAAQSYLDFMAHYPTGEKSEDAAYFNYILSGKSKSPKEIMAGAGEFLKERPSSPYRDKVLFDLGSAATECGDSATALVTLGALVNDFPKSRSAADAFLLRGNIFLGRGQTDSAAYAWQQAASAFPPAPASAAAVCNLADLAWRAKNIQEAIALWKKAASEFYYSAISDKALSLLPDAYLAAGEYEDAIAIFNRTLDESESLPFLKTQEITPLFDLAAAYEKKGDRQKAAGYYIRYLSCDRKGAYASRAFYALGGLARGESKMETASLYFKQAASLGGTGSSSKDIADLLFQTGEYAEAAKQYTQLARSADSAGSRQFYQARVIIAALRMDKLTEAQKLLTDFEKAYGKEGSYLAEFDYERGMIYYRAQDYKSAKKVFEKVAQDYQDTPFGPWGNYYLGKILEVTEKLDEAAKKYDQILKKYPDSEVIPRVLLSLGNMHFNAERYAESIRYYQQITGSPESAGEILPYAMNNLIEAYESTKLYDAALKVTRDYIERYPNDESIIDKKIKLGTLYTKIGYYDQAVLHFQNLINEAGSLQEAELRYDIGEAYYYKGDYQQAILEFLKVPYLVSKQGKVSWTATAFYMAGQSYEKMSKFDEAVGMYQQVIDRPGIDATFKAAARKEIDRVKSLIKKGYK